MSYLSVPNHIILAGSTVTVSDRANHAYAASREGEHGNAQILPHTSVSCVPIGHTTGCQPDATCLGDRIRITDIG